MLFVVSKRFSSIAFCGPVNIPAKTKAVSEAGIIWVNCRPICFETSENAHQHFARDDDGNGLKRGHLTQEIQRLLRKQDNAHQKRWTLVWLDAICQKYKRKDHKDHWLWNHDFYNAPIEDLEHIYSIVKKS